jgi:adhesin transport system membrane fusion protein
MIQDSRKTDPEGRPLGAVIRHGDLEFISDTSAAVLQDSPRGGRTILWATMAFFAIALLWAWWAELDVVTRGAGKVIPSRQIQVIQNLEGGIVSDIQVREGQVVEPGQVLLLIDDTRFASSFREARVNLFALKAKAARLRAEAEGQPFEAPAEATKERPDIVAQELELYNARQQELQVNLGILNQQVAQRRQELAELGAKKGQLQRSYWLVAKELNMTRPLVKEGAISEVEVLRLERQANDFRGDLEATKLAIPRAESRYAEAKRKAEEAEISFRNEARAEFNQIKSELDRISESSTALEDRVKRTRVRSPVRGTVNKVNVTTVGGVIQPGMDLIEIVPLEDTLLVEAQVRPADIAFLRPGLKAIVKFSAYDYAIYGGLDAKLEHISADTITDEEGNAFYLVRVRTDQSYLGSEAKPLPIIPGMTATVDILTGKKTVLEYLLKPVLRARERALRER